MLYKSPRAELLQFNTINERDDSEEAERLREKEQTDMLCGGFVKGRKVICDLGRCLVIR